MASSDKTEVNYLYFSFFFLFVFALTFSHFIHESQPLWGIPLLFLIYAGVQALLEVFLLIFIGTLLYRWMPRWTFRFYIACSFGFLLIHFANFTLIRVMDVSLSYFFNIFFGRGLDHVRAVIEAMNVNSSMLAITFLSMVSVPIVGLLFYWVTYKLSCKNPLRLSHWTYVCVIAFLGITLLSLDLLVKPRLSRDLHRKYEKTMPLSLTFLAPKPKLIALDSPLREPRNKQHLRALLNEESLKAQTLPNIYLFVIETLRRDFIDEVTAPFMTRFAANNIDPGMTFANANSTFISWFSLFHACYPYNWPATQREWNQGSVPLHLLQKLGYTLHVYSSADLRYFDMDQTIFGSHHALVKTMHEYYPLHLEAWERDSLAIEDLINEVKQQKTGNLFIIFLDSTHSEYSFPNVGFKPFLPFVSSIDYLGITRSSKDLELVKNRYRNSIFWIDHLIEKFVLFLKDQSLYQDSIMVITADHGEEFFETGALFHGTHLNEYQTKVPLFYRFPTPQKNYATVSSHIDVFPSLLHYLTGRADFHDYVDGESIFSPSRKNFALTMQHNGSDTPYEFRLCDGEAELIGRFLTPPNIYSIPAIELLSFKDPEPRETEEERAIHARFKEIFHSLGRFPYTQRD